MNLPFRAMVSDLDGTLLTPEHLVGDLTIDTLRALEQKRRRYYFGNRTQSYRCVIHSWKKIGAERAVMITSNGARVRIYRVICFIAIVCLKN